MLNDAATTHARVARLDVGLYWPARFHEYRCLRPKGAKTYQPGAERSAAPGAEDREFVALKGKTNGELHRQISRVVSPFQATL